MVNLAHAGASSSAHCVCLCVCVCMCVTTLMGAMSLLEVRYQQKTLNVGNKINIGIELNKPFNSYDSYYLTMKSSLCTNSRTLMPAGH